MNASMVRGSIRRRVLLACTLLTALLVASCSSEVGLTSLDDSDHSSVGPSMEVVAGVAAEDLELASSLGWTAGTVPAAEVKILRNGTGNWVSGVTGQDGIARFERLLPGLYRVYAERLLSDEEAAVTGGTLRAWGDGETVRVEGPTTVTLAMGADDPGSLVISEIGAGSAPSWEVPGGTAKDGLYLEVYNNGPTTSYLDGVLLGLVPFFGHHRTNVSDCASSQQVRDDDAGLYAHYALQFPGTGGEFPILPGEAKVMAILAQDLRQVHVSMPDLSGAAFEIVPPGKGDNPAVPNMIDVGFEPFFTGLLLGNATFYFLAHPLDFRSLPILYRDENAREYVRIPAEDLLDVAAFTYVWPDQDQNYPPCIPMVHESFVRYEGGFLPLSMDMDAGEAALWSLVRRVVRSGPFGPVLMRTRATAVDFFLGEKSPGWIEGG